MLLEYEWIFKWKMEVDEIIEKYKARFVVKEFKQENINYFNTYSHVSIITFVWTLIIISYINNL
jgi:hypothetical protein